MYINFFCVTCHPQFIPKLDNFLLFFWDDSTFAADSNSRNVISLIYRFSIFVELTFVVISGAEYHKTFVGREDGI